MKKIILFSITILISQELEVEGDIKVIGEIDASGNKISNIGNPVEAIDAVNLQTIGGLAGMTPERIYRWYNDISYKLNAIVPESKLWRIQ